MSLDWSRWGVSAERIDAWANAAASLVSTRNFWRSSRVIEAASAMARSGWVWASATRISANMPGAGSGLTPIPRSFPSVCAV